MTRVSLRPSEVNHWVRGETRAGLMSYRGQPLGVRQKLQLISLGFSSEVLISQEVR